ncbi:MAG: DUF2723 domain-containing protein [Candidatus Promineifilaceae bacterium]|nr:DUF2723 domain-containing protein [Candidatus Promineifilaceae bacterium]
MVGRVPQRVQPRPWLSWSILMAVVVLLLSLIAYLLTLSPDLTWRFASSDGAELIAASYTFGVAHPPGYPTYVVLGRVFSWLPFGSVAWRYHLFSGVSAALAAMFVALAAKHLISKQKVGPAPTAAAAGAAGLIVAFTPLFWQQAVVAEVYTLNAAFVAALVWALSKDGARVEGRGLLLGLACTTHLTSVSLAPLAIWRTPRSKLPRLVVGTLFGLTPYLLLPFFGSAGGHTVWGESTTVTGWWNTVSASIYQDNLFAASLMEMVHRLVDWHIPMLLLLSTCLIWALQQGGLMEKAGSHKLSGAFLAVALLYFAVALGYNSHDAPVLVIAALPLIVVASAPFLASIIPLGLALPVLLLAISVPQLAQSEAHDIRTRMSETLSEIENNALVIVGDEQTTFAMQYFQQVEKIRPDLTFVNDDLFQFNWYRRSLSERDSTLTALEEDRLVHFVESNGKRRPVCRLSLLWADGLHCRPALQTNVRANND